jgi:AraC-like DNA-binding protein
MTTSSLCAAPGLEIVRWLGSPHGAYLDTYVFATVLRGHVRLQYRRAGHIAHAGDLVLLEPGRTLVVRTSDDPHTAAAAVLVDPPVLASILTSHRWRDAPMSFHDVVVNGPLAHRLADALRPMLLTLEPSEGDARRLSDPIRHVVDAHGGSGERSLFSGDEDESSTIALAVHRAATHLHARYTEPISLDALARIACLSKYHLTRVFHSVYGLPPHAYQLQLRLTFAKRLISHGLSVAAAAQTAGFAGPVHLHRHFRARYGVAPGHYATQRRDASVAANVLAELRRLPLRE